MKIRYLNETSSEITDQTILKLCYDANGRIKPLIYRWLEEKQSFAQIKNYLNNRYNDIPEELFSYKEVLFRIKNHIDNRPTCQICGGPVKFVGKTVGGTFPTCYHATCCKEHERLLAKRNEEKTLHDRYGVSHTFNIPEIREKGKLASQSDEAKEKKRQTMIDRYGYEHIFQNPDVRRKAKENSALYRKNRSANYIKFLNLMRKENKPFSYYKNKEEYADLVKSYLETKDIVEKTYRVQKENGTLATSTPEIKLYNILKSIFVDVEKNYKEKRYNHPCDFYIPELDLFIEYQGSMYHGGRPYDPNDVYCKKKLQNLINKSELRRNSTGKTFTRYDSEIEVWTNGDVQKREEAIKNKLNYLEIYPNVDLNDIPKIIINNYDKSTEGKHLIIGID